MRNVVHRGLPRSIYLMGPDGTGKTTQAIELVKYLHSKGQRCTYLWLRFPHIFSIPVLAYARLLGLTKYIVVDGNRHGIWEFHRSKLVSKIFPLVLLVDTSIFAIIRLYLPLLLGFVVICDRFVYDILVDIMVATGDHQYYHKRVGRLFMALLPRRTSAILLDLKVGEIRQRRKDLDADTTLTLRRELYLRLAIHQAIPVVVPIGSVDDTRQEILNLIGW